MTSLLRHVLWSGAWVGRFVGCTRLLDSFIGCRSARIFLPAPLQLRLLKGNQFQVRWKKLRPESGSPAVICCKMP